MEDVRRPFGRVVRGSLSRGLEVRLEGGATVEALRAGQFVVLEGERHDFFALISDLGLASVSDDPLQIPPPAALEQILSGESLYGVVTARPSLMVPRAAGADGEAVGPQPARTIPGHFSRACGATAADVARIFGREEEGSVTHFEIGSPVEMPGIPLCVNMERLVERSTGIFGKSGTGKTFLTRLVLCSLLRNTGENAPVALVFDMHNEYGGRAFAEGEGGGREIVSVRDLFPRGRVELFSVGRDDARRTDFDVRIPFSQVEPEDVLLLHEELRLHRTAAESAFLLEQQFRSRWLAELLAGDVQELASRTGANEQSLGALARKLRVLAGRCERFLLPAERIPGAKDAVARILENLRGGIHTIVEFGSCRGTALYMLVANILARRIHVEYVRGVEEHLANRGPSPRPLVIAVEEAHKFLAPGLAEQTIFGTIAREMRKFAVTLLVIDQRPSGIDAEVLSQLGTKIACLLDNERDVEAVLSGTGSSSSLRGVLANLSTRQQALIMGHAVPMPVVVDTRTYGDEAFLRAFSFESAGERREKARAEVAEIFG